jgi:hypothetical protein
MQHDVVMDIDFDYCVRPTLARGYADRSRQPASMHVWMGADDLVAWLKEKNLFHPVGFAGAVESHEQVLLIWAALLTSKSLRAPFDLIHLDAHPDMMDIDEESGRNIGRSGLESINQFRTAKPGDFLQYAVRLGWVNRLWMVFPDEERDRIASLVAAGAGQVSGIVKKKVESVVEGATGGTDLRVSLGNHTIDVRLRTRATLPPMRQPVATTLTHSPEFVPVGADGEYRRLVRYFGGAL